MKAIAKRIVILIIYVIVRLFVTVIRDISIILMHKSYIFCYCFLQAILEQELRPYFDGKWKGLGDPHLSSYGIQLFIVIFFFAFLTIVYHLFTFLASLKKICVWELLGTNVLKQL